MAFIDQETKKSLMPAIKAVLKEYNVSATVSIAHNMKLNVNIKKGDLDFNVGDRGYRQMHSSYAPSLEGNARDFFVKLIKAMKGNVWFDESDSSSDYFNTAYYLGVNIGDYNKPYTQIEG